MVSTHELSVTAVDFLQRGMYAESRSVLCHALSEVRDRVDDEVKPKENLSRAITPISIGDVLTAGSNADSTFAMYKHAFLLVSINCDYLTQSLVHLYNMGLVYHALGLKSGNLCTLRQALGIYSRVNAILQSEDAHVLCELSSLLLAACNNMGHIYSILLNVQGVASCLDQLQSTLAIARASRASTQDMDFFLLPIVLGCESFLALAPAA
mmetsp:Transcript_12793/g.16766  ORF Transcript_12793/g.16766 Transcript_12793/m.16766 type:complete len:210 (+) Transcript_12793:91-720(+)|eukprot:CAMPEP_0198143352 /NCGR_PEP_ID=MMETSP1443-20131203/6643_1 /TAXON_ID=186043 /ORGANISM="Entomoneis sp., Strain CCMP2396" /LENGTH=209 /DNA_ID=CAMNT_0043806577 /DNA_START=76 /DNA_END=705 /DNA_ORIENTATION=+